MTIGPVVSGQPFVAVAQGAPTGLAGTMGVQVLNPDGDVVLARTTSGIVEDPAGSGVYRVALLADFPPEALAYTVVWDTDNGDPAFATEYLYVVAYIGGPCLNWCDGQDILDAAGVTSDPPSAADLDPYAIMASELLYEMSARQFSGSCEVTVRPCRLGCGCWGDSWGILDSAWFWGYGSMGWGYGWGWWDANGTSCGCGCDERLQLSGYPVQRILEVVVGEDVIDPAGYELQAERWLQRLWDTSTDPPTERFWPQCQNLSLPLGQPGTWSVSYVYGTPPPLLGKQAATELGWQLYLAQHNPGECMLPTGVTKVTRQGVTIERLLPMFGRDENGRIRGTGLVLTDAFLAAYNPNGLRRRPAVWTPDLKYPRRVP